jgi:DNA-directed RNA polymerase specialized sigma24 family protein
MRYLYDLPDAEIAAALDCRIATVRSLVSRGIATMRTQHRAMATGTTHGVQGEHDE